MICLGDATANVYDRVSYPTSAHTSSHPDRLAVMATLFGLTPVPVERCRVLELGCNDGWNLIPMAYGLPQSEFAGVDLAELPIARGRVTIAELGMRNIRLERANLLDFPPELGDFDYIIAHGIYSWVPEPVRDKLLAVVRAHLSPEGVAFVSYNANPAGRIRQMLREIMLYHAGTIEDPVERVVQGLALLDFVAGSRTGPDPYLAVVQAETQRMASSQPHSIFHDELEDTYFPVYFHEFAAHAARNGLQFLSEASLADMQPAGIAPEKYQQLKELAGGDVVAHEQYLDFAKFRKFRQTLLCHAERTLSRAPDTARLRGLYVASPARRTEPDARAGPGVERFEHPTGDCASTNNPLAKALLDRLIGVWPRMERLETLLDLGPESIVGGLLLQLHAGGIVELHAYDPHMAADPGERPLASRLARFQAAQGSVVITLQHKHALIESEPALRLLRLLDGTRDREALLGEMAAAAPEVSRDALRPQLDQHLAHFARLGLLEDQRSPA